MCAAATRRMYALTSEQLEYYTTSTQHWQNASFIANIESFRGTFREICEFYGWVGSETHPYRLHGPTSFSAYPESGITCRMRSMHCYTGIRPCEGVDQFRCFPSVTEHKFVERTEQLTKHVIVDP